MFKLLTGLTKAAVGVAVAPIAIAVDVVTLPDSALDPKGHPFARTAKVLGGVGENVKKALEP